VSSFENASASDRWRIRLPERGEAVEVYTRTVCGENGARRPGGFRASIARERDHAKKCALRATWREAANVTLTGLDPFCRKLLAEGGMSVAFGHGLDGWRRSGGLNRRP
jgi:hypothetical protein